MQIPPGYTLVNSVTPFFDSLEHVTIDTGPVQGAIGTNSHMLQGVRGECILEPLNLACLKPLHYFEYPVRLFANAQKITKVGQVVIKLFKYSNYRETIDGFLSVIKAALSSVYGAETVDNKVSVYYLSDEISGTYRGMIIAIGDEEWVG